MNAFSRSQIALSLEYFRATGGSLTQLRSLQDIVESSTTISEKERYYFTVEVLPMIESSFYAAVAHNRDSNRWTTQVQIIDLFTIVMSGVSATPIIPDNRKFFTNLVAAIILAIAGFIRARAKYSQPELSFLINRKILDGLLGEAIDRLTGTNEYTDITEDQRFILMAKRCKILLAEAESQTQKIIESTLSSPYQQADKNIDQNQPPKHS